MLTQITRIQLKDPTRDERFLAQRAVCTHCKAKAAPERLLAIVTNGVRVVRKTCRCGAEFEVTQ